MRDGYCRYGARFSRPSWPGCPNADEQAIAVERTVDLARRKVHPQRKCTVRCEETKEVKYCDSAWRAAGEDRLACTQAMLRTAA